MPEVMRSRRGAMQMSQAELATVVGIDKRQIKRYEAGESHPTLPVARAIAQALGISLDELAGDPPAPTPYSGTWHVAWHYVDGSGHHIATQTAVARQRGSTLALEANDRHQMLGPAGLLWHAKLDIHSARFLVGRLRSEASEDAPPLATLALTQIHPWGDAAYKARWMAVDPMAKPETGDGLFTRTQEELDELATERWPDLR